MALLLFTCATRSCADPAPTAALCCADRRAGFRLPLGECQWWEISAGACDSKPSSTREHLHYREVCALHAHVSSLDCTALHGKHQSVRQTGRGTPGGVMAEMKSTGVADFDLATDARTKLRCVMSGWLQADAARCKCALVFLGVPRFSSTKSSPTLYMFQSILTVRCVC